MQEYSDQDMAPHARAAESRIFYGWWVAAAFSLIIFLSTGSFAMAFTADVFGHFSVGSIFGIIFFVHQVGVAVGSWLSGFLFGVSGGYGFAFAIACGLLFVGAGLSLSIDVNERPVRCEVQPVAGGR